MVDAALCGCLVEFTSDGVKIQPCDTHRTLEKVISYDTF